MIRKLGPLALMLMLAAAFAAGCGGDDKKDGSSDAPATTAATTTSDDTTTAGEDASSDDSSANDQLDAAIEACKKSVDENPQVTADLKDDIKAICEKVRSNDPEELKKATRAVCETIVKKQVPEGDIRDQALQACANAG